MTVEKEQLELTSPEGWHFKLPYTEKGIWLAQKFLDMLRDELKRRNKE